MRSHYDISFTDVQYSIKIYINLKHVLNDNAG